MSRKVYWTRPVANCTDPWSAPGNHEAGLFLEALLKAFDRGQLQFHSDLASLADRNTFLGYLQPLRQAEWVVYAKPPFGGPQQALAYLARYTHRVAISNQRLLTLDNDQVSFQ